MIKSLNERYSPTNPDVGEPKKPNNFILVQNQTLTFIEASSCSSTIMYDVPTLLGSFRNPFSLVMVAKIMADGYTNYKRLLWSLQFGI
jgi:hypothetical protein